MKIESQEVFEKVNVFGLGVENVQNAPYFFGASWLNRLTPTGTVSALFNVTFEPGCRNNWHIHYATSGGAVPHLHRRRGLVSGGGEGSGEPGPRCGHHHPCRGEALARGQGGQLVCPYCCGSPRYPYVVV